MRALSGTFLVLASASAFLRQSTLHKAVLLVHEQMMMTCEPLLYNGSPVWATNLASHDCLIL